MDLIYSFQLVRRIIGGNWYLIVDYRRDCTIWTQHPKQGYQVLQRESWQ